MTTTARIETARAEPDPGLLLTPPPKRRAQNQVSPALSHSEDALRETLRESLSTLSAGPERLLLPPPKAPALPAAARADFQQHRYSEVGIVVAGQMRLWWEGRTVFCPTGTIFLIPPGSRYQPHVSTAKEPSPPHTVVWLALHNGSVLAHFCAFEEQTHRLGEYYSLAAPQVMAVARTLSQEIADRATHHADVVCGCLLCLFAWLDGRL